MQEGLQHCLESGCSGSAPASSIRFLHPGSDPKMTKIISVYCCGSMCVCEVFQARANQIPCALHQTPAAKAELTSLPPHQQHTCVAADAPFEATNLGAYTDALSDPFLVDKYSGKRQRMPSWTATNHAKDPWAKSIVAWDTHTSHPTSLTCHRPIDPFFGIVFQHLSTFKTWHAGLSGTSYEKTSHRFREHKTIKMHKKQCQMMPGWSHSQCMSRGCFRVATLLFTLLVLADKTWRLW